MTMQQSLEILARLAEKAEDQGYVKTHAQLSNWHQQLTSLNIQNPSRVMIDLLNKVESHIDRALNEEDDLAKSDAELAEECQASAQALFHSYNLTRALNKELQELAQLNQRAQTNQRYFDQKKNEAIRRFNRQVQEMRAKEAMNAAEIAAFNRMMQEMLEQDFAVKHLPKAPNLEQKEQDTAKPSQGMKPIIDVLSNVTNAANSGDQAQMNNAVGSLVGLLLSMVIESIATVCKTIAPSAAPFISQLAQLAKNAFSQWFSSSTGISMNMPSVTPADVKPADMPKTADTAKRSAAMPSTTFTDTPSADASSSTLRHFGGNVLHAAQQFMQRRKHQQPALTPSSKKPAVSKPVATATSTKPMTEIPEGFVRPRNGNRIPKPFNQ